MKTVKEILEIINQYGYDKATQLLETILSEHLRGKVYIGIVKKHVEALYFEREYYMRMMDSSYKPQAIIEAYIEKWGIDELVKYLTEREDGERQ